MGVRCSLQSAPWSHGAREASPRRPVLTDLQFLAVRDAAVSISRSAECMVVLAWETGHRIGAIRLVRWSDIDIEGERIRWRAENDKIAHEHVTPLSPRRRCTSAVSASIRQRGE